MIFFTRADGSIIKIIPEKVRQGSNKATDIYFLCPTSPLNVVNVAFTLPNGDRLPQRVLRPIDNVVSLNGIVDTNGIQYCAWVYSLPNSITAQAGEVEVQFLVTAPNGEVITSDGESFTVERGTAPIEPPQDANSYQELLNYVQSVLDSYPEIDSSLSPTSTNPVQNKIIYERFVQLENQKADKTDVITDVLVGGVSIKNGNTAIIPQASSTIQGTVIVDEALSSTSTNPVQNKVVNQSIVGLNNKIDTLHANAFVVVPSLPTPSAETLGKIYLLPKTNNADTLNYYEEYITVNNNEVYSWEKIGETRIDFDYNLLENQPIINIDMSTITAPTDNKYYRHTGATDTQFIYGCIYRYDGSQFIILGDLDKSIADKTYSNALKGNVGGTAIRIDDVSPLQSSVEVNVSGVSNPESVTVTRFGKNLINPQYFIDAHPEVLTSGYTSRGVTIKYIPEEDCWELNGSAEATVDQYGVQLVPNKFGFGNVNGKYITGSLKYVSGNIIGEPDEDTIESNISIGFSNNADGTGYGANLAFDIKTANTQQTITAYRDYYALYWLAIKRGQTFENYRFRLQLEVGDTATPYEKCTQESFTPDSNGNLEITGLRPTTTLLTNNASAYLLTNYTRDINAAINGTTETQPLATVEYVDTAIENNKSKLYEHVFNGSLYTTTNIIDFVFSMTSDSETMLVADGTTEQKFSAFFTLLRTRYGNNNVPNFNGIDTGNTIAPIVLARFTNAANFTFFTESATVEKIINLSDIDSISIFNENIIEIL